MTPSHRALMKDVKYPGFWQKSGVYVIFSSDGIARYCGQTVNLYRRLANHRSTLRKENCFCNRVGIKEGESRKPSSTKYDEDWYVEVYYTDHENLWELEEEIHNLYDTLESRAGTGGHNPHIFAGLLPWETGRTSLRSATMWKNLPQIIDIWNNVGHITLRRLVMEKLKIDVDVEHIAYLLRSGETDYINVLLEAHSKVDWDTYLQQFE